MQKIACFLIVLAGASANAQQAAGESMCVTAVKANLRDPESIRLVRVTRDAQPFRLAVDGRERDVRGYEVVVNARNGFGGYTGNQGWACVVDAATERTVLRLVPPS